MSVRPARARGPPAVDRAEREPGEERGAAQVGVHRVDHPLDRPVHDVGVDLAPEIGQRAAAEDPDRVEPSSERSARRPRAASGCCRRRPRAPRGSGRAGQSASERLWNPPRAFRSSTGERSPASHGVKSTPPAARRGGRGQAVSGIEVRMPVAGRRRSPASRNQLQAERPPSRGCWRQVASASQPRDGRDLADRVGLLAGSGQLIQDGGADRQVRLAVQRSRRSRRRPSAGRECR